MTYPRLREGDTVVLFSPAGPVPNDGRLERAQETLERTGLRVRVATHAMARRGYLAGSDDERLTDLNDALRDPDVRGLFALRGGYGTMRLLPYVDYDALRRDPKVVIGYSDLTALLNTMTSRTGVLTFHGPVASSGAWSDRVIGWLRGALFEGDSIGSLHAPASYVITPGSASGRLAGGNLSLIAGLVGTPYAIDFSDAIVLIEEVDEAPYRMDRMLTQLRLADAFRDARGIIVGKCSNCDVPDDHIYGDMKLRDVLEEQLRDRGSPILADIEVGHIEEQWTLPIGATARLDTGTRTLSF
ncbi:MAG: LD-carboxypeptidase [Candidatus Eremiobacteraeota bacterium]|nr:LD-carboxypeptidase [Candidatus Eremiobacteraeota bacterium]